MSTPIDKIINELTELATTLYDFLLRTEGRPERTGWAQQLEHCRKRVLAVRLLAGKGDYRGLHDVCLVQQEYLNALLADHCSPTSLDWEYLERWPLLVLPCIATPVSPSAIDEMVDYCRNVGMPASCDADELHDNLMKFSTPAAANARVVSLPVSMPRGAAAEAPPRAPVSEESSVRYLLQHELLDALSEYLARAGDATAHYEALRLCADRIQLAGLSAAGAGLTGLMDCCLLCHDALNRCLARSGTLNDDEHGALKTWTGLVSRYLEVPGDLAGVDALMAFYQRGNFIAKLISRDYDNLRDTLIRDGAAASAPAVESESFAPTGPSLDINDNAIRAATDVDAPAIAANPAVTDRLQEIEQQLAATIERNAQLKQLAREVDQYLATHSALPRDTLIEFVRNVTEISNESYLASQAAQMHINVLGELIAGETKAAPATGVASGEPAQSKSESATSRVHALLVKCSNQLLAVSVHGVERVFHAGSGETAVDDAQLHYVIDNMRYDACELETLLQLPVDRSWLSETDRTAILVQHAGHEPRVVFVESVLAAQELEVRPIGPYMPDFPGITGVTQLGNGELAPVVDLPDLLRVAARHAADPYETVVATEPGERL